MPEITVIHIIIFAALTIVGAIIGWTLRSNRAADEKAAVNAGWQNQIEAQRNEHDRLVTQNKGLMEQVSQYQASNMDAKNRAKELSAAVQEAFSRRDDLQREIKDIRSNLEVAVTAREQLQSDLQARGHHGADAAEKDEKISRLTRELENWQNRLPPLIERYRARNAEAEQFEADLATALARILELEAARKPDQIPVEAARDQGSLSDRQDTFEDEPADESRDESPESHDESHDESQADSADKLQQIKGIGPAIEKTLNEMGIFHFHQLAEMSEYDIDRVAQRLKGFRSRIYREDWIGQARELRDQNAAG